MKLAWILYGGLEQRTGGTIYDRLIVEGLRAASGDEVEVISIDRGGDASAIVRRLAHSRPDVVVGDELCFRELAFIFSRFANGRMKRVLLVHHRMCWEEELSKAARKRARVWESSVARHADLTIATSQTTRARLGKEGVRGRIEVVLPGADRLPGVERVETETPTRFLFLGAVIARKRVRELVRAFVGCPSSTLRIVGSLAHDPRYVASLEIGEGVELVGELDDDAIARELARADALVMPSSLEGYGIAATEAVRAGVPVIAARAAGLSEALARAGDDAVIFVDPNDLHHALIDFTSRKKAMREAAERAVMPSWSDAVIAFRAALRDA